MIAPTFQGREQHLPAAFFGLKLWCLWHARDGRKIPIDRNRREVAWGRNPIGFLLTFKEACALANELGVGVGFVLSGGVSVEGRRLLALDVDACRDPVTGALMQWGRDVIACVGRIAKGETFVEISTSGTGLRVWLLVAAPPLWLGQRKVTRDWMEPAPNADKTPNVQFFGLVDGAQFVTWTGDPLTNRPTDDLGNPDPHQVARVDNVDELLRKLELNESTDAKNQAQALPRGKGKPPTSAEIEATLRRDYPKKVDAMFDADWPKLLPKSGEDYSASAGYWVVVQATLRAAKGHGRAALDFLLEVTDWGCGLVEESADPDKYARRTWVAKEIARAATRTDAAKSHADAFDDGFAESLTSSAAPAAGAARLYPPDVLEERIGQVEWLVDGLLARHGLAQFFGPSGAGKSTFVVGLVMHVVAGAENWCGRPLPAGAGRCVYISGEGTPGLLQRMHAARMALGLDAATFFARMRVSDTAGELDNPADVGRWLSEVDAFVAEDGPPLRAVVIDTRARNTRGDENSTQDTNELVRQMQRIADRYRCLVVLVHHTGLGDQTRGRGNSAMLGALDAELRVAERGRVRLVVPTKVKDREKPQPFAGRIVSGENGAALFVLGAIEKTGDELVDFVAENPGASIETIRKALGVRSKSTVQKRVAAAIKAGELRRDKARRLQASDGTAGAFEAVLDDDEEAEDRER